MGDKGRLVKQMPPHCPHKLVCGSNCPVRPPCKLPSLAWCSCGWSRGTAKGAIGARDGTAALETRAQERLCADLSRWPAARRWQPMDHWPGLCSVYDRRALHYHLAYLLHAMKDNIAHNINLLVFNVEVRMKTTLSLILSKSRPSWSEYYLGNLHSPVIYTTNELS